MSNLDIINEIFEEFFEKLNDDNEIPKSFISDLKTLWLEGKFDSKKEILNLIKNIGVNYHEDKVA